MSLLRTIFCAFGEFLSYFPNSKNAGLTSKVIGKEKVRHLVNRSSIGDDEILLPKRNQISKSLTLI